MVVPGNLASVTRALVHVDLILFAFCYQKNSHCLFHKSPHLYISLGALSK